MELGTLAPIITLCKVGRLRRPAMGRGREELERSIFPHMATAPSLANSANKSQASPELIIVRGVSSPRTSNNGPNACRTPQVPILALFRRLVPAALKTRLISFLYL